MTDVAAWLANGVQVTTDGHRTYLTAAACLGAEPQSILGNPDPDHISTRLVERSNLTVWYICVTVHRTLKMTPALVASPKKKENV